MSREQCTDDRFEIISETKQHIIDATNIEMSPDKMKVLDDICFRLWQLGLTKRNKDRLRYLEAKDTPTKFKIKNDTDGRVIWGCPRCGKTLVKLWSDVETVSPRKYCDECGQALEWE